MANQLKLKLPVTEDGVRVTKSELTPEQIEAKRLQDEAAEKERLRLAEEERIKREKEAGTGGGAGTKSEGSNPDEIDTTKVIINDVEYTLNETGDAIDKDGKVVLTKAEIDKAAEVNDDDEGEDPFEVVQTVLDFKPVVNGQPIVYEKTKAGLEQLILDGATAKAEVLAEEIVKRYWEQNPQLKQLHDHYTLNGSVEAYRPEQVWSSIDVTTLNDEQMEQVILTERITKGDTPELAKYFVDGIKKDGKLKEFVTPAITFLANAQNAKAEQAEQLRVQERLKEQKRVDDYWKSADAALASKKLTIKGEDFVIPASFKVKDSTGKITVKTINDFNDYIRKEKLFTIDGNQYRMTEYAYDLEMESRSANVHNDLFNALRKFLKDDDSQLVKAKAQFEEVKKVRKLVIRDNAKPAAATGSAFKLKLPVK